MNIIIALILVSFLPIVFMLLLPKNNEFFKKPIVKGFGLGVYAALIFVLLQESFEHGGITLGAGGLLLGLLVSFFIGYYFQEFHHHHEDNVIHVHTKISAAKILVSDFFHNIVDGIAIVSGFAINNSVGIASLVGVLGHQIIQQSGQQMLLVSEGVKPKKAIFVAFLISLSVFLGLLVSHGETIESVLMSLSAGIILFKIITDIKEANWSKKSFAGFVLGFSILLISLFLVPHTH